MTKLEAAFIECLRAHEYPGPVALNRRMGRGEHNNHLNGRDTYERRRLMRDFGVPMKRGNYGTPPGEIPNEEYLLIGDPLAKEPGWRKDELNV